MISLYGLLLTQCRLGPYKLAYVLNKCLDRFEHPDENVPQTSDPTPTFEVNLPQSRSIHIEDPSAPSPPAPAPAVSPPPVEMPPLVNQPYWHATDKPRATSSTYLSSQFHPTPPAVAPVDQELRLPIFPKLTIPSQADSTSPNILITDDNVINRRVSLILTC